MFGNKRLAKRSIIGTRVCALWPQDGRYYPGVIQSQVCEENITSPGVYAIRFDDGFSHHIKSRNIIGSGFQSISSATLKRGQKVFLTLNGREVCGTVERHDRDLDEVVVCVTTPSGEEFETARRLEEVRLLESRKSARLVDQADTDYSKLADLQLNTLNEPHNRKRTSSHVIDVPTSSLDKHDYRRHRRQRRFSEEANQHGDYDDTPMMDETIAALVLTSLSVSPKSPSLTSAPGHYIYRDQMEGHCPYPDSHLSSSVASSGFCSGHSERDDHSPPLPPLSESAPATVEFTPPPLVSDDDSSGSSGKLVICEENEETIFQCTWRGCIEMTTSRDAIERHIRRTHFHRDSDLEMTDNEEDFHYTELDVSSVSTMTKSFAALNTSSPREDHADRTRHRSEGCCPTVQSPDQGSHGEEYITEGHKCCMESSASDHDYQRKSLKLGQATSLPSTESNVTQERTTSLPISIDGGQIQRSLSWQIHSTSPGSQINAWQPHSSSPGTVVSPTQRTSKLTPQERLYQHQVQSPKSNVAPINFKVSQHRRTRSEVRKCRKVYGMDHRDQWCTQCKWKKACTRFID